MASPARHRERARKIQLPAVQSWEAEQQPQGLRAKLEGTWGSGHWQISATRVPSLACFKTNAFSEFENHDAFIVL